MNFAENLKTLRKGLGITQLEASKRLGISRVNYTRYENDKARPDYETLIAIADLYDVTLDELLGRK